MIRSCHRTWRRLESTAAAVVVAVAGSWVGPVGAVAQDPAVSRFLAFQDSIQRSSDLRGLDKLERALMGAADREGTASLHLRLGLLALRIGELGDASHYDDAASEFQWATELVPASPLGWFGLGMAEYALGRAQAPAEGDERNPSSGILAVASAKRSMSAFARAAALDGMFAHRLFGFATESRHLNDPGRADVALRALRAAATRGNRTDPAVLLALGRTEREFGDLGRALAAFDRYRSSQRPADGVGYLEVARTRFLLGRADGVTPYLAGARFDDSLTVAEYRRDLETVASAGELRGFDRTAGTDRVTFLTRFWEGRDAREFRQPGERIREHYRRLYEARRAFPLRRAIPTWGIRFAGATELDDRGRVFVRHGDPDDRATLETVGIEPNESWRYTRPGADLIVHFVARRRPENYRLVESLFDVVDAPNMTIGTTDGQLGEPSQRERRNAYELLLSRAPLASLYRRSNPRSPDEEEEFRLRALDRTRGRASLQEALTTDTYRRRFQWDLGVRADAITLRPAPSVTEPGLLRVSYAVPGERMEPIPDWNRLRYPLRIRLLLSTLEGAPVAVYDTALTMVRDRLLTRDQFARGEVNWEVPAGRYVARMLFEHGSRAGTIMDARVIEVSRPAIDSLSAGDILITGRAVLDPVGSADQDSLPPSSLESYSRSESLTLTLPVEAPRPWHDLVSHVVLIQRGEGGGVRLNQTMAVPGRGQRIAVRHLLDTRRLNPGQYSVEVTVTAGDGRLVRRWRELTLTVP